MYVVNFNYVEHVAVNKDYLKKLYQPYFKKIIFYSDVGAGLQDEEVNYIHPEKGRITQGIFKHFYHKYYDSIDAPDGIFYTMDDNVLNLNTLNLYRNDKVICCKLKNLNSLSKTPWFNTKWSMKAILSLLNNQEYIKRFK